MPDLTASLWLWNVYPALECFLVNIDPRRNHIYFRLQTESETIVVAVLHYSFNAATRNYVINLSKIFVTDRGINPLVPPK